MQDIGAQAVLKHEADAEEPADGRRAQVRRIELADVDAIRAVDARIDPADRGDGEENPDACRLREPQMEERADEIIQEQDRPTPKPVDEKAARGVADESRDRLHE